jgi:hypothetical protein
MKDTLLNRIGKKMGIIPKQDYLADHVRAYPIPKAESFAIGCSVPIGLGLNFDAPGVSRTHCFVTKPNSNKGLAIFDNNSTNHTYVKKGDDLMREVGNDGCYKDDQTPVVLQEGEGLVLGNYMLKYIRK